MNGSSSSSHPKEQQLRQKHTEHFNRLKQLSTELIDYAFFREYKNDCFIVCPCGLLSLSEKTHTKHKKFNFKNHLKNTCVQKREDKISAEKVPKSDVITEQNPESDVLNISKLKIENLSLKKSLSNVSQKVIDVSCRYEDFVERSLGAKNQNHIEENLDFINLRRLYDVTKPIQKSYLVDCCYDIYMRNGASNVIKSNDIKNEILRFFAETNYSTGCVQMTSFFDDLNFNQIQNLMTKLIF